MTTTVPRPTLTSRAPCFIAARNAGVDQAAGLAGAGHDQDTTSARGSRSGRSVERVHAVARGPGDAQHVDLEGHEPPLDVAADVAVPDDQHGLVGQRGPPALVPAPRCWSRDEAGDAAQRGERQGQRELGGGRVVDAPAVAQQHALGDLVADVVDPRGQRLHDLEPRHPREDVPLAGAEVVRRDVELAPRPPTPAGRQPCGTTVS